VGEIALALLKKYVQRYYKGEVERFQAPFREYGELTADDTNFFDNYEFTVDAKHASVIAHLQGLRAAIETGSFKDFAFNALDIFRFEHHLYYPLVHLTKDADVKVRPVQLNEGERNFVVDLREYHQSHKADFAGTELYLLRNMTRGKGIGFFEAGNFYPDFILWLLRGGEQHVTFLDPKGITRLEGPTDPKIDFFRVVKEIEHELGDPAIVLNSFIIANTPYRNLKAWGLSKAGFESRNVLFQHDDRSTYIAKLFAALSPTGAA